MGDIWAVVSPEMTKTGPDCPDESSNESRGMNLILGMARDYERKPKERCESLFNPHDCSAPHAKHTSSVICL
jgi:hypothetical protein